MSNTASIVIRIDPHLAKLNNGEMPPSLGNSKKQLGKSVQIEYNKDVSALALHYWRLISQLLLIVQGFILHSRRQSRVQ